MIKYQLVIFAKPSELGNFSLLQAEAELVKNFQIKVLKTDSVEAYQPKIAYRCSDGQCALTNEHGHYVTKFNRVPVSFFELRKILLDLGYFTEAQAIQWQTT